jgi:hypothetical protein
VLYDTQFQHKQNTQHHKRVRSACCCIAGRPMAPVRIASSRSCNCVGLQHTCDHTTSTIYAANKHQTHTHNTRHTLENALIAPNRHNLIDFRLRAACHNCTHARTHAPAHHRPERTVCAALAAATLRTQTTSHTHIVHDHTSSPRNADEISSIMSGCVRNGTDQQHLQCNNHALVHARAERDAARRW